MSNLQRDVFKKKIQEREERLRMLGLEPLGENNDDEEDETDSLGDLGMPPPR